MSGPPAGRAAALCWLVITAPAWIPLFIMIIGVAAAGRAWEAARRAREKRRAARRAPPGR